MDPRKEFRSQRPETHEELLADAEHKKRAAAPQKKRYDFDF